MTITIETFKENAEYLRSKGFAINFETKKKCIEWQMQFNENGHFEEPDYDFPTYIYVSGKRYESDEITLTLARKAECIILSWDGGWTVYIGRTCTTATLTDAYENSLDWYVESEKEWESLEAEQATEEAEQADNSDEQATEEAEQADNSDEQSDEQADNSDEQSDEQEAQEAKEAQEAQEAQEATETAHHTIYDDCAPVWTPCFAYDISHARTASEQRAFLERATQDAPAAECVEEESWYCNTGAPTDPDTAIQESDAAALTRTAEDQLYHQRAAEQAAEKAKKQPVISFIITLIILIMCITGLSTIAQAFNKTAPALTAGATAITGEAVMAKKIEMQTTATATPAPATATAPATTATAPAPAPEQAPKQPTLAQLLAKALEAQKTAQEAPQTPEQPQTTKETITLKTALKRALMAPKTGTTECVIYSTLYAAIRIEEVTTPAPAPVTETQEEGEQETKSAWTFQADTRRVAFMRELRNVARGRAYCENVTSLLNAIDAQDDDFLWKTPAFTGLPAELRTAIKSQFEAKECTESERQECRDALDPHAERLTLHRTAIETACETLARQAPEWTPLLFEEQPAPATLRQAILELQYCIFPIDSSPRARVFRGLEGIDFKTLSTPEDYKTACKAASLRAGEPSTAIPPESRARVIQWRSGAVTTSAATVTSTAARLAAVWGMD